MLHNVYRIEDRHGKGPFLDSPIELMEPKYESDDYPTPDHDGIKGFWDAVKSGDVLNNGCTSIEQLRYWFDRQDCEYLTDLGFKFTVWAIDDAKGKFLVGKHQVLFSRLEAECVQRKPARALWE